MATAMSCCHQHNLRPPTFSCSHRCCTPPPAADPLLHCPHSFPAPSAAYSGPFCCPDSSYHQFQKRPNQQEFRRSPHHPPEHQSQTQCPVFSSLLRRIHVLESSFLRSSPPPPPPTPLTLRDFAARTIQSRFRGFLIHRSRAFREIKELASVKSNLDSLKSSIPPLDSSSLSREALNLIGRLETIQGVDKLTKEGKVLILRDFAQLLEVVEGMICVRRSVVSCAARESVGVSKNRGLDSDAKRLIDELRERVKRIQEVSEVLEDKDGNVEDGSKRCKCYRGDLIQEHSLQSNAGKRVRFLEDRDFVEHSTTWLHNFDEYMKEAVSRPSDDDATLVYNFDEYSATRVHNSDGDDTAVYNLHEYSATRIHDFDEYREECMSKPSDNVKNTEDAAEKQYEDDEEVESDAEENLAELVEGSEDEGEENGTVSNEFSQGTDGEDGEDLEETLLESDEDSEDENEENGTVNNDYEDEENPEESFEGSEDEDGTEYESSEYEHETENEDYEDEDEIENEDEMEDEDGEDEDEAENGTSNGIPQENKQTCDSAVMSSANVANSAQPVQQRATHNSVLTLSDLYVTKVTSDVYVTKAAADAISGSRHMKNVICHQCYKRGHMKRECWFNPARRCRDCNMLGHTRQVCTHFSDQQSQNAQNS